MKIYKINIIVFKNKVFQYNINIMAQDKSEKEMELIMVGGQRSLRANHCLAPLYLYNT